jgi:homeobox protein abdominal-B
MNASTTTVLNDTRHCFLQSFTDNQNFSSINSSLTSVHPSISSTLTTSSFPSINNNRCDSTGDSVESVSSTTSNNSIIDSDISFANNNQKDISFPFYSIPYNSEISSSSTQPVVNPFIGFASAFPSSSNYRAQGYPYPSRFFQSSEATTYQRPLSHSQSTTTSSTPTTTPTTTITKTTKKSSKSRETILTNNTNDLIAAAAVAAAAAASTSGTNPSSSSTSSTSSTRSSTAGAHNQGSGLHLVENNNIGGTNNGNTSTSSTDDHIQRLAQMTHGVGLVKSETGNSDAVANLAVAAATADVYQTAAAAYAQAQAYGNWQNYYQFNNQMAPAAAAFPGWPGQCYPPSHWAQTKKGRQTYQRYQTSVLEGKFQQSSYVSKKQREELRLQTNLTDRQIKIWFQNRRMKAKKEKNRCDDQTEQNTLIPANPPKNLLPGSMHHHQQNHLLMDDPLGIGLDQDKLKSNNQSGSMLNNPQNQMWCSSVNMNNNGTSGMHGMVSSMADTMASWPMLPPTASQLHSQGVNITSAATHPHYPMGYGICPPNI